MKRRQFITSSVGALTTGLAGCISSAGECQPATFPQGTETREEPPEPCQYLAELDSRGLDTDSVFSSGGGVSVMYYRDPERHREQIRTVAVAFVPYRRMVDEGMVLSFTALETADDRHGTGYVAREWARERAQGSMTESEYVQRVVDTYGTR